jgi:hypothetical protein
MDSKQLVSTKVVWNPAHSSILAAVSSKLNVFDIGQRSSKVQTIDSSTVVNSLDWQNNPSSLILAYGSPTGVVGVANLISYQEVT